MNSFTTLGKGHNAPCLPITPEEWLAARKDPKLAALCERIKASHNASQQRKLKSQLPVWTPRCGAFKGDHRAEVDALCQLDRLMFDIDEKGQTDRVLSAVRMEGEQAYIGDFEVLLIERSVRDGTHVLVKPLRLNFTASTTVGSGVNYLRLHLKDGTFTRASLCTIFRPIGELGIPKYGTYDEAYKEALAPYIQRLNEATGLIDCPEAYQLAEELYRENEDRYVLSADEDFRELSYRSLRIAYDRAVMIYLMEGCQWSEEIATFMRWLMEYDLWVKLYYFSDELWDIRQREKRKKTRPGRGSLLRKLPDRFDLSLFQAVYQANGHTSDPKDLLSTWMKRGHISYDETTGMYQKKRRD